VEYVSVEELDVTLYVPSPDDPYPGLITSLTLNDPNYYSGPSCTIDWDIYKTYILERLDYVIATPYEELFNSHYKVFKTQDDPELLRAGELTYSEIQSGYFPICSASTNIWTREYGLTTGFSPSNWNIEFEVDAADNNRSFYGGILTDFYYSVSLGRMVTPSEYFSATRMSNDEAYELWKDDYQKYVQGK
jgi:hypothetical protein